MALYIHTRNLNRINSHLYIQSRNPNRINKSPVYTQGVPTRTTNN
jgi:hypothetical protein